MNSVGQLDGKKLAASVLLYVFIIGFPASPLEIKCTIGNLKLYIGDSGLGIGDLILGKRLAKAKIG